MQKFNLYVSYSQIFIFDCSLDNPFNGWNDKKVSQGFSWRESSVSFKSLLVEGVSEIRLIKKIDEVFNSSNIDNDATRVLSVPFSNKTSETEVST